MARNIKANIKVKTENKRHEDKIANVLKSMKERKDRKRISLDDRLQRMHRIVKKQEKANLVKKKSSQTSEHLVPIKSKREKVPTERFLDYQKSNAKSNTTGGTTGKSSLKDEVLSNGAGAQKKTPSKDSTPKTVNQTPKEEKSNKILPVEPRSPRVRVQTQKFLEYQNRPGSGKAVDTSSSDSVTPKSCQKTVDNQTGKEKSKQINGHGTRERNETKSSIPANEQKISQKNRVEIKTPVSSKRRIEESQGASGKRDRVRVPTSRFLEYQKSLTEEIDGKVEETSKAGNPGKQSSKTEEKEKEKEKERVKPPSKTVTKPASLELDSRKRMMDEILNAHYAKMNSSSTPAIPQFQNSQPRIQQNGLSHQTGVVPSTRTVQVVPEKTKSPAELRNYIYIKVDDEISIKSPVKPTNSFAKFVAGMKVTDQEKKRLELDLSNTPAIPNIRTKKVLKQSSSEKEKKIINELARYPRIAPKGLELGQSIERRGAEEVPSYVPCHLCDYVATSRAGLVQHLRKRHPESPVITEFFHFPNFLGFNCSLRNSRYQLTPYYVTEVTQPQKNGFFPMPENLSQTCLFFIPQRTLGQFSELKKCSNIYIPYQSHAQGFSAHFPLNPNLQVSWATNISSAEFCVGQLQMFILTKSRFKLIQSVRSGRDKGGGGQGGYGGFCQFTDQEKVQLESAIRMQTEPMLQSLAPTTQETSPQVMIDVYRCPFKDCDFVSDRKFSGIRNHFLKHFKDQIEKEAKPRAFLTEREKSNCMSKTGCSVAILTARGELVHHFGIFHCAVDDLFQEYAIRWLEENYPDHVANRMSPYEDYQYENYEDLLKQLSLTHYFNAILSEVEDMVKFSLTYFEEYKCMANMYKCPFCKKKFKNLADGSNVRDVKEMVVHCGVEHGFALYYLMSDQNIAGMRQLLRNASIKEEPLTDQSEAGGLLSLEAIKLEPMEETETEINNFLEVEMYDSEDV